MARGRMTRTERHAWNVRRAQGRGFQPVPVPGYPGLVVHVACSLPGCRARFRPRSREAMQRHLQLAHALVIRLGRAPVADLNGYRQLVDVVVPAARTAAPCGHLCGGCGHLGTDGDPHGDTCPGKGTGPAASWKLRPEV